MSKYPTHTLDKNGPIETEYELTEEGEVIIVGHKFAPRTLSERYTEIWGLRFEGGEERTYNLLPEVEALEAELLECKKWQGQATTDLIEIARERDELKRELDTVMVIRNAPISPRDALNLMYEKLGMTSALVVNKKYGKRSTFGYMGREW